MTPLIGRLTLLNLTTVPNSSTWEQFGKLLGWTLFVISLFRLSNEVSPAFVSNGVEGATYRPSP